VVGEKGSERGSERWGQLEGKGEMDLRARERLVV
jgi:hypothetical protein